MEGGGGVKFQPLFDLTVQFRQPKHVNIILLFLMKRPGPKGIFFISYELFISFKYIFSCWLNYISKITVKGVRCTPWTGHTQVKYVSCYKNVFC